MTDRPIGPLLAQIAEDAVPETFDRWPVIEARVRAQRAQTPGIARRILPRWKPAIALATAAVLVLVAVLVGLPLLNPPQSVSAQAILDRAQDTATNAAPTGTTTYHLTAMQNVPAKGNATVHQEIWYAGSDRQRTDATVMGASGTSTTGSVFNGAEMWTYMTENGQTRVIHTTGTSWNKPATTPTQGSVADLLARYNQKGCQTVQQQGQATILNRTTYVIVATPKGAGCRDPGAMPDQGSNGKMTVVPANTVSDATARAAKATAAASQPSANAADATAAAQKQMDQANKGGSPHSEVGQMTVWVDTQTFLPLKTEVRDTTGALMDHYEVTSITFNVQIPDATFQYIPPAGAQVSTFTGGDGSDVKATLGSPNGKTRPNGGKETPTAKKP